MGECLVFMEDSGFPHSVDEAFPDPSGRIFQLLLGTVSMCLCIYSFIQQTFIESFCIPDALQDFEDAVESKAAT